MSDIKASTIDEKFDNGENVDEYFDMNDPIVSRGSSKGAQKNVNVFFPLWMVEALDNEAVRLGVNRQAVIKMFVDEGLERRRNRK